MILSSWTTPQPNLARLSQLLYIIQRVYVSWQIIVLLNYLVQLHINDDIQAY